MKSVCNERGMLIEKLVELEQAASNEPEKLMAEVECKVVRHEASVRKMW